MSPHSDTQTAHLSLKMLFRFSAEHNSVLIKGVLELDGECDMGG